MCDEYEDERMWAFWRRLEIREELEREERETKEVESPIPVTLPVGNETPKARPRTLTH